jgi:hypothetical protein
MILAEDFFSGGRNKFFTLKYPKNKGRFQDGNLVRPSPTENKAWCKPNPNHFSIQVVMVPGQMVSERIGLKNGIVLSFSS